MITSLIVAAGCNSDPSNTIPEFSATTPEARLELVMHRLDSAIVDAAAAQGSGVVSQRKSSHRLIPPEKEGDPYRAEVMIETIVSLARAPAAATLPKKAKEAKPDGPDATLEAAEEALQVHPIGEEEPAEDPESNAGEDPEKLADAEIPDNGVTRRAIEQSKEARTDVYELVYEDDRWRLASEISDEDEVGQALFDYALRQ